MLALLHTIVARTLGLLRPANPDSEFDQELNTHLAMAVEDKIRRGLSPEQARRAAHLELGGLTQLREAGRAARGLPWLNGFWLDLKLGLRMLRKSWGLTLVGGFAMTVTIGLGASVLTIWSTLSGTTVPLDEGDRIVAIQRGDAGTTGRRESPLADFDRWRTALRSVTDVSAMRRSERALLTPDSPPRPVSVAEITASGFRVARVRPLLGRPLIEDDERAGAEPVAVIGQDVWESGFSSDPAILGRRLQLDQVFYTVVGVMPVRFGFPVNERIWTPLRNDPSATGVRTSDAFVFARLAPGVTIEGARAEVATLGMLPPAFPADVAVAPNQPLLPRVVPYAAGLFDGADASSWIGGVILFVVVLLLIPPCANIGILVYARTVTRQEEFAARYALGASRSRIVVQIFVEVLVLSTAAGIAGFLLSRRFAAQLSSIVTPGTGPDNLPFWMDFTPSAGTVFSVAALAIVAAVIAGGVPALHVTGRWRQAGLHAVGNRGTIGRLGKTWSALLATQVALSLAILPSAMELTWGIFRPNILGPGFAIDEFLTAQLAMEGDTSRFGNALAEIVRRLRDSPGVYGVTVSDTVLMEELRPRLEVDGNESARSDVAVNHVDSAFFDVFEARFLAGRGFDAGDFAAGQSAVIVNRSFVEEAIVDGNPLGRRVRYSPSDRPPTSDGGGWFEIVGVVDDFIANEQTATMYHPLVPGQHHPVSIALRAGSDAALVSGELREIANAVDPGLRVGRLHSLGQIYRHRRSPIMMFGLVLVTVMVIVLLFTMAGNYSLMAFTVAQRWREIGLRSALGAQPRRLVADIFGRALVPLVAGAILGGLLALMIGSSVDTAQIGGRSVPAVVPACAALMIAIGLLALIGPARRALRIDPAEALRDG